MSDMGKKTSKYAPDFAFMQSLPNTGLKHKDPNAILHALPLPQKYKEEMGPDPLKMQKMERERQKKEAALKKLQKDQPDERQKEKEIQKKKLEEEEKEIKQLPTQIYQDEQGRIRDKEGKILIIDVREYLRQGKQTSSLDINRAKQRESKIKQLLKLQKDAEEEDEKLGKFFDQTLKSTSRKRDKKLVSAFQFISKGAITERAEQLRAETNIKKRAPEKDEQALLEYKKLSQIVKKSGVRRTGAKSKLNVGYRLNKNIIPEIEWWDKSIVAEGHTFYIADSLLETLVEQEKYSLDDIKSCNQEKVWDNPSFHHNMLRLLKKTKFDDSYLGAKLFESHTALDSSTLMEMFKPKILQPVLQTRLTKEEKTKQAKERRREYQKDLQEKIKYGIIEAPKPKLKLATYMKTLSAEAIQDPTKVEMEVRKLVEERQQKHIERNESRKLTTEQKAEKRIKKIKKDSAKECRVCLFKLKSLHDFKIRNKVVKNAQDLALNGFCLIPSKDAAEELPVVLVAEGGPKSIKFFKNLLLRRIDWTTKRGRKPKVENPDPSGQEVEEVDQRDLCNLIWEGLINDHIFPKWSLKEIHNELEGRRHFADRGVEEYWEKALSKARSQQ
jgi:U4/U6 small nuclear ribonucleoprotein PRP3